MNKRTESTTETVLRAAEVGHHFTDGTYKIEILNQLNLQVQAGERLAIMGASGSGKSSLLHILGGLERPTLGQVYWGKTCINKLGQGALAKQRNHHLGFVYQAHHLLRDCSVLDNVCLPLRLRGHIAKSEQRAQALALLDAVNLSDKRHRLPAQLSGGERQRVAIARALVGQPACVLADEPTGNLDYGHASQVFELLLHVNERYNSALIVVTHDPNLAAQMDKTYVLEAGRLTVAVETNE